ncbi:ATPase with role in protein import into the ER, partial [Tulasnella sp. 408]
TRTTATLKSRATPELALPSGQAGPLPPARPPAPSVHSNSSSTVHLRLPRRSELRQVGGFDFFFNTFTNRLTIPQQFQQPATASSSTPSSNTNPSRAAMIIRDSYRVELERLNNDPFGRTFKPIERVLKDVGMEEDIDDVDIVGGSTRIPDFQSLFNDFFDSILAEQYRHSIGKLSTRFRRPTKSSRTHFPTIP